MTGDPTTARLPACAEDSLCVVDWITGSRAATLAMMQDGGLFGLEPPPAMLATIQTCGTPCSRSPRPPR